MPHTLISLPTYTTAAMAHDLLAARQIRSEITRTFAGRNSSCGYSIKIDSRYMPEAQYLLVARRRDFRTDGDDAAELVRPHDEPGVVTAHAAVPGQQPFQRRRPTRLRRRLRPISLHSSFEIVVRHRFFFFRFDRSIHLRSRPAGRPPPRRVYSSPAGGSVRTIPLLERPSI